MNIRLITLISDSYLVSFPPSVILQSIQGKLLRPTHYKIDKVPTSCQAAQDQKVGQHTQEASQMDVVVLSTLLLLQYSFLQK